MSALISSKLLSPVSSLTRAQLAGLKLSIVLLLIGSPLGIDVLSTMKFSVANCFQIVAAAILLICFFKYIRRGSIFLLLSYGVGLIIPGLLLAKDFNLNLLLSQDLYFAVCIVCLLLAWEVPKSSEIYQAVRSALRIGVPSALLIMYGFTFRDMLIDHLAYTAMGFDDKSHAAVYIAALAFLVLEMSSSVLKIPIALFVFASSFLTVSRLSAIMIPFFLVALVSSFSRVRLKFSNKSVRALYDLIMGVMVIFLFVIAISVIKGLPVFSRLIGSGDGAASGSTQSHFILIQLAIEMKFIKPWIIIFGTTPGLFSYLLPVSGIDYSELAFLDPGSQYTMAQGALPVHSVPASIFLEFPIWMFVIYVIALFLITKNLIKAHRTSVWTMFIATMAATMFYSGHNEPYFLTLFLISILFMVQPSNGKVNERNSSVEIQNAVANLDDDGYRRHMFQVRTEDSLLSDFEFIRYCFLLFEASCWLREFSQKFNELRLRLKNKSHIRGIEYCHEWDFLVNVRISRPFSFTLVERRI